MLELNKTYNLDCMEGMAQFPDKYFELAIVDPPYGIGADNMTMGRGSRNDKNKNICKNWDNNTPKSSYFNELFRVSKSQIIWGGNYFPLPETRCYLIWDKMDYNSDFASAELAWTSFDKVVKTFRRARNTGRDVKIHPTQKPIDLYRWTIKNYAKPGDKILDTHGGSFSSVIACLEMGFEYIAFEIDEEYYNNGLKRIDQYKSQLKIFQP